MIHIMNQKGVISKQGQLQPRKTVTVKWAIVSGIVTGDVSFSYERVQASRIRRTSDSSSEFLKIENEQIETAQNNFYG